MARIFNIWNFYQAAADVCEFDITVANLPRMKDGTDEFIQASLQALGINGAPTEWQVTPFRSYYLSEYTDTDRPWEGRWDIGWMVRVALRTNLNCSESELTSSPVGLDARDTTWAYGDEDPRHDTTALVIADFRGKRDDILGTATRIVNGSRCEIQVRSYARGVHQVRCTFNGVAFPEWIKTGDTIVEEFKRHGGLVNFRDAEG